MTELVLTPPDVLVFNRKQEAYCYLDVGKVLKKNYELALAHQPFVKPCLLPELHDCAAQFIFNNGNLESFEMNTVELSENNINWNVSSKPLISDCKILDAHLVKLNHKLNDNILNITLKSELKLIKPIYIHYCMNNQASDQMVHPQTHLILENNARAELIECYWDCSLENSFTNSLTQISLKPSAYLNHIIYSQGHVESTHFHQAQINIATQAEYECLMLSDQGAYLRTDYHVYLQEQNATSSIKMLEAGYGSQKIDRQIYMHHMGANTKSTILARGVAKDEAVLSILGKIIVAKTAYFTDAHFENKNLILSNLAKINTRPLLEIDTNEVKCAHGATVGCLDEDALFYLTSRGISRKDAENMLLQAFMEPVIDGLNNSFIRSLMLKFWDGFTK